MVLAFCMNNSSAEAQVQRNGNTFSASSTRSTTKGDTIVTSFKWEDSHGETYPIICSKKSGACYIWKQSKKTGRMYRQYMKPEVSEAVCKELNINYTPKKK